MVSPRWHKILRDLWSNKTRTALVVLSVAVGVFAIGAIATTKIVLDRDMTAAYLSVSPAQASLFTSDFDDDLVHAVERMDGVAEADGRTSVTVRVQTGSQVWRSLQLIVIPDYDDIRTNIVRPVAGAWPPPKGTLLIERASLGFFGLHIGDTVVIETPDGEQRRLEVTGTTHDINQPPALFTNQGLGYITFETFEWLGWPRFYDELSIITSLDNPSEADARAIAEQVRDKVERSGRSVGYVYVPVPGKHPADQSIKPTLYLLGILGAMSLLSAGFLVVNTIGALLTQQTRQIGVMKAIGARAGQITSMYLSLVLVFGLLALILAVPLGALGAMALSRFMASIVNFDLVGLALPPQVLALEMVVALLVPVLAAVYPVLNGARMTVREAISSYGVGSGGFGAGFVDRALERVRFLSRPLLVSLRNTFRRKGRLALTLITLTLSGTIFVGVFSVQASLLRTLDEALKYWQYDVEVSFSRAHRVQQLESVALEVPGVVAAESWAFYATRRERPDGSSSQRLVIVAPPAQTEMLRPKLLEGRWLLPEDESAIVLNTDVTRDEKDIHVGDEVTLKIEGHDKAFRVVGIVQSVLTGPIGYVNYPYLARTTNLVGRAGHVEVVTEQHDAASLAQIAAALEKHYERLGMRVTSTETTWQIRQRVNVQFNLIIIFLLIMAVLLALVGGLGLMGTMSLNVLERTREVGVLRAVGAADGAIRQIVIVEGLAIGVLSWLVSTLVALPLSMVMSNGVGRLLLQTPLSYAFSTKGAAIWLAVVVIIAVLASLLPARKASRVSVREALAYE